MAYETIPLDLEPAELRSLHFLVKNKLKLSPESESLLAPLGSDNFATSVGEALINEVLLDAVKGAIREQMDVNE